MYCSGGSDLLGDLSTSRCPNHSEVEKGNMTHATGVLCCAVVLCCVMLCCAVLCCVMLCCVMMCCAVLYIIYSLLKMYILYSFCIK